MKRNMLVNKATGFQKWFILSVTVLLFVVAGCTASKYDSQKYWHRAPASTGHNRCGCLLNPSNPHNLQLYKQPVYALQA